MNHSYLRILIGLVFISLAGVGCQFQRSGFVEGTAPVVPANKFSLKGFYLGMSESDARRVAGMSCKNLDEKSTCSTDKVCWIKNATVAGVEVQSFYLNFKDGEVTLLGANFDSSDTVRILAAFTSEYGDSKDTKEEEVVNGFGAKFKKVIFSWKVKDAKVDISNRFSKASEGVIVVSAVEDSPKALDCRKRAIEGARKDL